jgi:hypothetical protein
VQEYPNEIKALMPALPEYLAEQFGHDGQVLSSIREGEEREREERGEGGVEGEGEAPETVTQMSRCLSPVTQMSRCLLKTDMVKNCNFLSFTVQLLQFSTKVQLLTPEERRKNEYDPAVYKGTSQVPLPLPLPPPPPSLLSLSVLCLCLSFSLSLFSLTHMRPCRLHGHVLSVFLSLPLPPPPPI